MAIFGRDAEEGIIEATPEEVLVLRPLWRIVCIWVPLENCTLFGHALIGGGGGSMICKITGRFC